MKCQAGESHDYREAVSVFKMFSVHTKTQSPRFQIPPVEERFRKAPFSCGRLAYQTVKP